MQYCTIELCFWTIIVKYNFHVLSPISILHSNKLVRKHSLLLLWGIFCGEITKSIWWTFMKHSCIKCNFFISISRIWFYWLLVISNVESSLHEHLLSVRENLIRPATTVALITLFSVNYSELYNPDYSRKYC